MPRVRPKVTVLETYDVCLLERAFEGPQRFEQCLAMRHSPIDRWCLMPGKLLRTIGGKQISKTQDEPQWIVAQGYSQHLQYLDSNKSSTKDLSLPLFEIMLSHNAFDSKSS